MAVSPRELVEFILLGPTDDRRQLQDSPILTDVWIAFAEQPHEPKDLLITPYWRRSAGKVAAEISRRVIALRKEPDEPGKDERKKKAPRIAYLQGVIAASLYFDELLQVLVPLTDWWKRREVVKNFRENRNRVTNRVTENLNTVLDWAERQGTSSKNANTADLTIKFDRFSTVDRYLALAALISWAGSIDRTSAGIAGIAKKEVSKVVPNFLSLLDRIEKGEKQGEEAGHRQNGGSEDDAFVWQVSLNRTATPALGKSVPSVKADAVRKVFSLNCSEIYWAIIDSGIDGSHPAFNDETGCTRIQKTLDFSRIREIVSLDNLNDDLREDLARKLVRGPRDPASNEAHCAVKELTKARAIELLATLADDVDNDRPVHWELVEELVEIRSDTKPSSSHGTHVAGILAANAKAAREGAKKDRKWDALEKMNLADGMCPDIRLYDLRVLARSNEDTEFAVIAALQYLRYLKERHKYTSIHGANLSLSIPHDVRNHACGRTPVCDECERLVESGIVVVAAAGNRGYQSYETKEGAYEGYTAFSITDPGNADGVITVGATHRSWPHTYGVSFFSSRGPTGDGRLKPDLVAPGERIESALTRGDGCWGELDGTSMAAPHVSGAAAMLMARYPELVGRPRRIKQILCEGATDLGRERSFQGNGMLDVLRAFQRI